MKALDDYLALQEEIFSYFGYVENWVAIPIDDCREYYWRLDEDEGGSGTVTYADTLDTLNDEEAGNYYQDEIYTQRFLPKWVYRGAEYTMICCNPGVDGNKFLRIFNNAKEAPRGREAQP